MSWPLPVLIVEVAFANNQSTPIASCTWTDVTKDVVTVSTQLGKQDPTSTQADAGRMVVRLFNNSGQYNPYNTSSANYGPFTDGSDSGVLGLVPLKRIRFRATWSGTTYAVWHGFVESWQMVWPSEKENFVDVTAVDGFKQMNLRVMGTVYEETVRADAPVFWARLGDQQGSTSVTASIPQVNTGTPTYTGTVGSGVTLGQTALLADDANTSATFDGTTNAVINFGSPTFSTVGGLGVQSIECWVTTTDTTATVRSIAQHGFNGGTQWSLTYKGSTHTLTFTATQSGSTDTLTGTTTINDGKPHHIVITVDGGHFLDKMFVDGVFVNSLVAGVLPADVGPFLIGGDLSAVTSNWSGSIQDFAIYASILDPTAQVLPHYQAGATAFAGDTSGTRIGRLLTFAGWPTADRTLDAGVSTLQGTSLGQGGLTEIQTVVETEGPAVFFMGPDGTATFYDRNHLFGTTSLTSQVTLGESGEPYLLDGIQVDMDDLQVWNIVPISRQNGVTVTAQDATSMSRYGPRTFTGSSSLQMSTDAAATDLANYLLFRYKDPQIQPHSIVINPNSDANNLYPHVLGRKLLDRVTVTRQAPGSGVSWSQQCHIIGIAHTVDPSAGWQTTWTLSPYESLGPFLVLDDVTFGILDTDRLYF